MSKFYFFTEQDKLSTQTREQAFGPVLSGELLLDGKDRFLTTDLHSSGGEDLKAFAICDGTICVQQAEKVDGTHYQGLVNLILKPSQQPDSDIPYIAYFIYKGIKANSLWNNDGKINSTGNDLTNKIQVSKNANNNAEPTSETLGIHMNKDFEIDNVKYFKDDDPIDNLFYRVDSNYPNRLVYGGEWIGNFHAIDAVSFGLEIIAERIVYKTPIIYARRLYNFIEVESYNENAPIEPPNNSAHFQHWHQKDEILNFIDPCSFWGSFREKELKALGDDDKFKSFSYEQIYTSLLKGNNLNFFNLNKLILDIRNEHNYSLNSYKNYGDLIRIKFNPTDPFTEVNYYDSKWPFFQIDNSSFIESNAFIFIELPKSDNTLPLIFISQLATNKKQENDSRFRDLDRRANLDYTYSIKLPLTLINDGGVFSTRTGIIRLIYLRQVDKFLSRYLNPPILMDTTFPNQHYLDGIFQPYKLAPPWTNTNNFGVKIFHEEVFINENKPDNKRYIGNVGIAESVNEITYFVVPLFGDCQNIGSIQFSFPKVSNNGKLNGFSSFLEYLNKNYTPIIISNQIEVDGEIKNIYSSIDNEKTNYQSFVFVLKKEETLDLINDLSPPLNQDYHSALTFQEYQIVDSLNTYNKLKLKVCGYTSLGIVKTECNDLFDVISKTVALENFQKNALCSCNINIALLETTINNPFPHLDPEDRTNDPESSTYLFSHPRKDFVNKDESEGLRGADLTNREILNDFFQKKERYDGVPANLFLKKLNADSPLLIAQAALQYVLWYFRKVLEPNGNIFTGDTENTFILKCLKDKILDIQQLADNDGETHQSIIQYFEKFKSQINASSLSGQEILGKMLKELLAIDEKRSLTLTHIINEDNKYLVFLKKEIVEILLNLIDKTISNLIINCTQKLYSLFGGDGPKPVVHLIAIGEGSPTIGILGRPNHGIRLFNYNYFQKINGSTTFHTSSENEVSITTFKHPTSCYLSLLGSDYKNTTIIELELELELELVDNSTKYKLYLYNKGYNDNKNSLFPILKVGNVSSDNPDSETQFKTEINKYLGSLKDNRKGKIEDEEKSLIQVGNSSITIQSFPLDADNPNYSWTINLNDKVINVGSFNINYGILKMNQAFVDKTLNIKIKGFVSDTFQVDETMLSVIMVPSRFDNPSLNFISTEFYFSDNQYEVPNNPFWVSSEDENNVLSFLQQIASEHGQIGTNLYCGGVGVIKDLKLANTSKVTRDKNQEDRTAIENGDTPTGFSNRRYTSVQLLFFPATTYTTPELEIVIEGYASPLRCTWGSNFPGNNDALINIINPRVEDWDNHQPNRRRIYNSALSGMRTMGALDAVINRLINIAQSGGLNLQQAFLDARSQSNVIIKNKKGKQVGNPLTYQEYTLCQ